MKAFFADRKLNHKFTMIIFIIVFVPVFALTGVLLQSTLDTLILERTNNERLDMEQLSGRVNSTVEAVGILMQAFEGNANLIRYLQLVVQNEGIDTLESLDFYRNDIATLSKFTHANAYLYQIRVYVDSGIMPEMMPVLYRAERMKRLDWAETVGETLWHYDYADSLFSAAARRPHLMGMVKPFRASDGTQLGVIEAAVDMESLFPELFGASEQVFLCLQDDAGNVYYDPQSPWSGHIDEILRHGDVDRAKLDGVEVILSRASLPAIGAKVTRLASLEAEISASRAQRGMLYAAMSVIMLVLAFLINITVKALFRRFYGISRAISAVEMGDISVRAPETGGDEFAEMGKRVNAMLDKIDELIKENTGRELIMKDTEIRALHNQINAHFLYNVLESIKMMAEVEAYYPIADAVTSLGKLLRYSLRWSAHNVTIAEEIAYIQDYMLLMNLRFDHQIGLAIDIPDTLWTQAIPKISLQPIVENAIGHGLSDISEDACISISAFAHGGDCIIEITDPGKGMDEATLDRLRQGIGGVQSGGGSGHGIGLKNVQERIRTTFGGDYGIEVLSVLGEYTRVVVKLPLTWDVEA